MANQTGLRSREAFALEGVALSPSDFYDLVVRAIAARQIPGVVTRRIYKYEGLPFISAQRLYLRISLGRLAYDVFAAPNGDDTLVTWERHELPSRTWMLWPLGLIALLPLVLSKNFFESCLFPLILLAVIVGAIRKYLPGLDEVSKVFADLGRALWQNFTAPTAYQIDAASDFQRQVEEALRGILDGLCALHGLRSLSESQ